MQLPFYLFFTQKSGAVIHDFLLYVPVNLRYISKATTSEFRIQADELAVDLKHEVPEVDH